MVAAMEYEQMRRDRMAQNKARLEVGNMRARDLHRRRSVVICTVGALTSNPRWCLQALGIGAAVESLKPAALPPVPKPAPLKRMKLEVRLRNDLTYINE